jgi:hypothetical protein
VKDDDYDYPNMAASSRGFLSDGGSKPRRIDTPGSTATMARLHLGRIGGFPQDRQN